MRQSAAQIAIIDYGMGNRRSAEKAFLHVGADAAITHDPERLMEADALVLPGVGAFPRGMEQLAARGLDRLIAERVDDGVPLLGICLGMQLLFERSSEMGGADGLGLIEGSVVELQSGGLRLPHIGWNEVHFERKSPLFWGIGEDSAPFYHVHSFVAEVENEADVIATAHYGQRFVTAVASGNVYGVQFHPEKSSRDGLRLLSNFCAIALAQRATLA